MLIRVLSAGGLIVLAAGGFLVGSSFAREVGLVDQPTVPPLTSDPAESQDLNAVSPRGNMNLQEVRDFTDFAVYWLGPEYEGLPLNAIIRANYSTYERPGIKAVEDSVTLLYGACVPPPGEGGCAAPVQVVIQEACQAPPGLTASDQMAGPAKAVRGAPAEVYKDGHMQMWTENVSITIFGPDAGYTQRMASGLRPVNAAAAVQPGDQLPAPKSTDELGCGPLSPARALDSPNRLP